MDYKKLGLKCGIEIHQQLKGKKLFCECPTLLRDDQPHFHVSRKLRASAGESGTIDVAAAQEQAKQKSYIYEGYDSTCLVELDEEPPHPINKDSLYTVLQFSKLVKSDVNDVVQVMRKTVVDGSNTSGFQRTALVARNGSLSTSQGEVGIMGINIEEEAAKIVSETNSVKTYRLDRLGIPLIEIGTNPDIHTPEQCQEVSQKLGMLLRSLPGVKRGLGTIRQDVNVSIKGGSRIEVKGFQDLKLIPKLVDLEVKRQMELLKLKDELRGTRLAPLDIIDLSTLLTNVDSKILQSTLEKQGKILGIRLNNFAGFVGRELQPGNRLGSEFSARAKVKSGIGGIFHSDELPNYGIERQEIIRIRQKLKCEVSDAFILVAAEERQGKMALEAVYERAQEVMQGVPSEVRKDKPDGTTVYMRPMPGSARMYPETDVPLIFPDISNINLPELLDAKIKRFQEDLTLSADLARLIGKSDKVMLFEELVDKYPNQKPAFIADTLTGTLREISRQYHEDPNKLTEDDFRELFKALQDNKIHKDIVLDVLIDMCRGTFQIKKYASLSTEDIHHTLKKIVAHNPKAPFPALMGMAMKALAGKASGKFIAEELKKLIR